MEALFERAYGLDTVALGPSSLQLLAADDVEIQPGGKFVVHSDLIALANHIVDGSHAHGAYLTRMVRYFDRSRPGDNEVAHADMAQRIAEGLLDLVGQERVIAVGERDYDPELASALAGLYATDAFAIRLSPKKFLLRNMVVGAYSWSKATGGLVIDRTQRLYGDLGHHVAALQLPDRIGQLADFGDKVVTAKSNVVGRFFKFRGGKVVKFFVGAGITVGGAMMPASPIFAGAGIVIMFTDP